jgi:hypothetical protein
VLGRVSKLVKLLFVEMWDVGCGMFVRLFEGVIVVGVVVMDGYRRGGCNAYRK